MKIYWISVFKIPKLIIQDIEKLLKDFYGTKGRTLMVGQKWLGKRCVGQKTKGAGAKEYGELEWYVFHKTHMEPANKEKYYLDCTRLKNWNFWEVEKQGWLAETGNIWLIWEQMSDFFVAKVKNRQTVSSWFDNCGKNGPLCNFITIRHIFEANLSLRATNSEWFKGKNGDVQENGRWIGLKLQS